MKTASVRQVQHHLSEVLRWVEEGDEVLITRRNRVVAKLVPAIPAKEKRLPRDWAEKRMAQLERIYGKKGAPGKPGSQIIIEGRDREEHF